MRTNLKERREAQRTDFSTDAEYRVPGRPDLGSWTVHTINISSKGILLSGKSELPVGDRIEIALNIPSISSRKIVLCGRTVRIIFNEKEKDKKDVAIKFEKHGFTREIDNFGKSSVNPVGANKKGLNL